MTTYTVTTSNWNSPAFWSGINEGSTGHTLDFSALPSNFTLNWDPAFNSLFLSDGSTTFSVGDSGSGGGADAYLGGSTLLSFFDQILGTQGDDILYGTSNDETLSGGAGDDSIFGDFGDDSITGGDGDDLIQGNWDDDTIDGGSGSDTMQFADDSGVDVVDGGEGGSDQDVLEFVGPSGVNVVFTDGEEGNYNTTAGTGMGGSFTNIEEISATDAADTVDASAADESVTIRGTGGDDSLVGGSAADTISGGDGQDTIRGNGGADTLDGGAGQDSIFGGSGDDTISGGSGADYLDGGDDRDTFAIEDGFGNDTIVGGEGGDDRDTIDLSGLTTPVTVTYSGDEAGTITNGTHTITFSQIEHMVLTDFADVFDATLDTVGVEVDAGAGNDTITGGSGGDTIDGGQGDDSVRAGAGDDVILSSQTDGGADTIFGEDGNDSIQHGIFTDSIDGGSGDDTIVNVYNTSSAFTTTVTGGDGTDTYALDNTNGGLFSSGHIVNLQTGQVTFGGGARDEISDFENIELRDNAAGAVGDGNANEITATGDFANNLQGGGGNDTIDAGGGDDTVAGDDGSDSLIGGDGNDSIAGGAGGDTLVGGAGNDTLHSGNFDGSGSDGAIDQLYGGDGDDVFVGDAGLDYMEGGLGNDSFDGGDGADQIYGEEGDDTINAGDGDDVLIRGGDGNDEIHLGEGNDQAQGNDGNDTIYGDAGADTIGAGNDDDVVFGGEGDDLLGGEAGDDTLDGGDGDDVLVGGAGNDTFVYAPDSEDDTISDFNTGNTGTLDDGDSTNNDFVDLSGYYDHISELYADQADDGVLNQSNATDTRGQTTDYSDNDAMDGGLTVSGASADESSFTQENTGVVCFTAGTLIHTVQGEVPVELLRPGARVITRDNGPQVLRWIATRELRLEELAGMPNRLPVKISPLLTGAALPLIVSPQHGVLVRHSDGGETLVRATHLAAMKGGAARTMWGCRKILYLHLMFDAHQIIFANGAAAESFYPGPEAVGALSIQARGVLFSQFPRLMRDGPENTYGLRARAFWPPRRLPNHICDLSLA